MSDTETKTETEATAGAADSPVVAKLKALKAEREGDQEVHLPSSGITATIPKFRPYSVFAKATRLAKGDASKATEIVIANLVRFDGQQLTRTDLALLPGTDMLLLQGVVMADMDPDALTASDDDEDPRDPLH